MSKNIIGGVALFLTIAAFGAHAFALPLTSPAAGSDQVRATRPLSALDALVFTYKKTITSKGALVSTEAGSVKLGADFSSLDLGPVNTLDDFALCRVFSWKTDSPELNNDSCFYGPAFRLVELANRQQLNLMLAAAFTDKAKMPGNLDPYWAEQELAVQHKPSDPLTVQTRGATTQYSLHDHVVVQTSLAGSAFSAAERQRIARYLSRHVDLHPQVLRAILASGQLPSDITIERYSMDKAETETFHLGGLLLEAYCRLSVGRQQLQGSGRSGL